MQTIKFEEVLAETGFLHWKTAGVSMRPLLRQNRDLITVKRMDKPAKKYDVVLFRRPGVVGRGAYVLHRVLKTRPDGTAWIVGDNCYRGELVRPEQMLGVLTAIERNGKTVTMDNFWYKVYVHLWCDLYPVRFFILLCIHLAKRVLRKLLRPLAGAS